MFLKKLIQTLLLDCVSPCVNIKNNADTSINFYNFLHLVPSERNFHWLSDLGGREKQTYHAMGLGEWQTFKGYFLETVLMSNL